MNPTILTEQTKTYRALVVDDHPAICRAIRQMLETAGDIVLAGEAGTAAEALALVASVAPDIAVVDLRLPDTDGVDLIIRLRELCPKLRILVFSSADERLNASQVRTAGAHGFVSKMRDPEQLLASMRLVALGYTCFASNLRDAERGGLSRRETSVLHRLIRGQSNVEIAAALKVSPKTVSTYRTRLMRKLQLRTFVDLVDYAKAHGLGE